MDGRGRGRTGEQPGPGVSTISSGSLLRPLPPPSSRPPSFLAIWRNIVNFSVTPADAAFAACRIGRSLSLLADTACATALLPGVRQRARRPRLRAIVSVVRSFVFSMLAMLILAASLISP